MLYTKHGFLLCAFLLTALVCCGASDCMGGDDDVDDRSGDGDTGDGDNSYSRPMCCYYKCQHVISSIGKRTDLYDYECGDDCQSTCQSYAEGVCSNKENVLTWDLKDKEDDCDWKSCETCAPDWYSDDDLVDGDTDDGDTEDGDATDGDLTQCDEDATLKQQIEEGCAHIYSCGNHNWESEEDCIDTQCTNGIHCRRLVDFWQCNTDCYEQYENDCDYISFCSCSEKHCL